MLYYRLSVLFEIGRSPLIPARTPRSLNFAIA